LRHFFIALRHPFAAAATAKGPKRAPAAFV
jgi:hypothetical protein